MNDSRRFRRKISSGEFSNTLKEEARAAMRAMFHRETEADADPVVELVSCLLEDGAGSITPTPDAAVTLDQWQTWNRLVLERPKAVTRMLTRVLERERPTLPSEPAAMRSWAGNLLLSTLERLGMA